MAELSIKPNKFMSKKTKLVFPKWIRSWRYAGIIIGISLFPYMKNIDFLFHLRSVNLFFSFDNLILLLLTFFLFLRWSSIRKFYIWWFPFSLFVILVSRIICVGGYLTITEFIEPQTSVSFGSTQYKNRYVALSFLIADILFFIPLIMQLVAIWHIRKKSSSHN